MGGGSDPSLKRNWDLPHCRHGWWTTLRQTSIIIIIDFSELPPAKGRGRQASQSLDGQVVVVQAADLLQSRRIIPDLATWTQCYALYVTVVV